MPPTSRLTLSEPRSRRSLLALIGTLLLLWTIWATAVLPRLSPVDGVWHTLRGIIVRLLLWVLPCAVYYYKQYDGVPLQRLGLGLPKAAHNWWVSLFTIVAAATAVSVDVARKLSVSLLQVWVMLIENIRLQPPVAEFFEELVFRGVILSEMLALLQLSRSSYSGLSVRARFWLGNAVASLVFVGLHWPWWIYTEGMGTAFLMQSGGVFLISLVLGMLFVLGRSLWPCVVLHWLNNALSSLVAGA